MSDCPNLQTLCSYAATLPAPHFYVSTKRAMEMYNQFKRTGSLGEVSDITHKMYMDLFKMYEQRLSISRTNEFKYILMQETLNQPAPSFYICRDKAAAYYYRAMKNRKTRHNELSNI